MAFRQFSELAPGELFAEGKVLHAKIEPLGTNNAIILTGRARGQATTFADTAFVDTIAAKDSRVLDDLLDRAEGRSPPNFHPAFQLTTPGSGYFIGSDGFAYAYEAIAQAIMTRHGDLQGAPALAQLRVLGLEDQIERGQTPHPIPATFY